MTAALAQLLYLACLAAIVFLWCVGWATLMERFAGGSCPDCRKGALCARCLAESEAIRPPKGSA